MRRKTCITCTYTAAEAEAPYVLDEVFGKDLVGRIRAAGPRAVAIARALARMLREGPPRRVTRPEEAYLAVADMADLEQETLRVILLSTRGDVIAVPTIYVGSVDAIPVRPAEIFREAIRHNAVSLIVAHNHPSGDPTPSPQDLALTRGLIILGRVLEVEVKDHIIVARGGSWISLRETSNLPWDAREPGPGM